MNDQPREGVKRLAGIGTLVAAWAFFDGIILGLPIVLLSVAWRPGIVFVVGAGVWTLLNVLTCRWIDREWDAWVVGSGFEARIQRARDGKRARRAVEWVERGSAFWFGLAAVLTSAGQIVALNRLVTGGPTARTPSWAACLSPAIFWSAIFSLVGVLVGDGVRAL